MEVANGMSTFSERREWMSDNQWRAAQLVADVFGGFHHLNEFKPVADGVQVTLHAHDLATFDYDLLTGLVILAHSRCIRVAVVTAGMRLAVRAYVRQRDGAMHQRHPTMEQAIERWSSRMEPRQ